MTPVARLWRSLDPRRSLAARLLWGSFLAFFIPGTVFVVLLVNQLRALEESAAHVFAASREAEAAMRLRQDALFRAEWLERRAQTAQEAAWSLAGAVQHALEEDLSDTAAFGFLAGDDHGHLWTRSPEEDSVAFISSARPNLLQARRDVAKTRKVAHLMKALRERRNTIRNVSIWTVSGVMRHSPWMDLHAGIRQSGGALEDFVFNRTAHFPQRTVAKEESVWLPAHAASRMTGDPRLVTLFVPVRSRSGELLGGLSFDIDARRWVDEALSLGNPGGDIWFAVDSVGHALRMPPMAANILSWRRLEAEKLMDTSDSGRRRLARAIQTDASTPERYTLWGDTHMLAHVRVRSTGWVFVEGLSEEALLAIGREARLELQPRSYSAVRRDILLLFVYLLGSILLAVLFVSRRVSAPVSALVHAAESIGRGRSVAVEGRGAPDELGRLAGALDLMGRRVERRVETLRRLHLLFRASYRMVDLKEVLARCSEAIAAFTRAERVVFFLHDPETNRLKAGWPGWNITEELISALEVPLDERSITAMVFQTGELYYSNDLERDPYVHRETQRAFNAINGMYAPLKIEEGTIGVVMAVNRPGGFGPEEVDAMVSFADAATLLIKHTRLYAELTGTVEELRRASRLKDQFLQNINHELRTPLTSIVGWLDLFEEEALDEATRRRGLRQVRHSSRVLLALIDDLLDLARMDRGALSLDLRPVSLPEVIQRSIDTVRLMAEARSVAIITAPMPGPLPAIRADPLRLQQVLWNLLSNAIKFTSRHGRIVVRVEREPERFVVSVEDDGIGIPESELPHVFERFRQVDGSPTRRYPGMGIGLSLARSLVELHGGTIRADSVVGQGSRFVFTLPIRLVSRPVHRAEPVGAAAVLEEETGT
jgi:signal transduction histidine kinase/HAMP domain-containing protein